MKAIVAHAANDLRIEDRERPTPGVGQVLIRMKAGGICGSDLHYYHNGGFGAVRLKEPMILGHEVSGIIETLGEGVTEFQTGQLVAISPSRPCQACEYCQAAKQNHCINMRFYGSAMPFPHIQGAFQEWLVADAAQAVCAHGVGHEHGTALPTWVLWIAVKPRLDGRQTATDAPKKQVLSMAHRTESPLRSA